jgi:hypothetical protein
MFSTRKRFLPRLAQHPGGIRATGDLSIGGEQLLETGESTL